MRFNIRSLLIVVVYVAVGCAGLVKATEAWASAVVTLTVATLLAAAVVGACSRGSGRAIGGGFALAGIGYLAVVYAPGAAENIAPHLATTKALAWAVKKMHGEDANVNSISFAPDGRLIVTGQGASTLRVSTIRIWDAATGAPRGGVQTRSEAFFPTGHCLWFLIAGCLGGLLGQFCYARSVPRENSEKPLSPNVSRDE